MAGLTRADQVVLQVELKVGKLHQWRQALTGPGPILALKVGLWFMQCG